MELFRQSLQFIFAVGGVNAPSGNDDRSFSLFKHLNCHCHCFGGRGRRRSILIESRELIRFDVGGLNIEGDIEPHGARASGLGEFPRLFEVESDALFGIDHRGIFGNRAYEVNDIELLIAELPELKLRTSGGHSFAFNLS